MKIIIAESTLHDETVTLEKLARIFEKHNVLRSTEVFKNYKKFNKCKFDKYLVVSITDQWTK